MCNGKCTCRNKNAPAPTLSLKAIPLTSGHLRHLLSELLGERTGFESDLPVYRTTTHEVFTHQLPQISAQTGSHGGDRVVKRGRRLLY